MQTRSNRASNPVIHAACLLIAAMILAAATAPAAAQCPQYGGEHQDFRVRAADIAPAWPDDGPRRRWSRDLGPGYSAIIADDRQLYTMYRDEEYGEEVVVAFHRPTGEIVWEHRYDCPVPKEHIREFNAGPRATPALHDGRLYTIGMSGKMRCLDARTGRLHWQHDLREDYNGTFLMHGYASSPYVHRDKVIALVGGKGRSIVAFDRKTGKELWKKHDFDNSYSTPKLISVDGEKQLLCFMAEQLVAVDPDTGDLKWTVDHKNRWKQNVALPVWGDDNILVITSVDDGGGRGLKLHRDGDKTRVEELWFNRKFNIHHSTVVRQGDYIYTSTGGMGKPGQFQVIDVKTGKIKSRQRGFDKATFVHDGNRFILLDEKGNLGMATVTPDDFEIHGKCALLGNRAWAVPTLVDNMLYVRDNEKIVALDLSRDANGRI